MSYQTITNKKPSSTKINEGNDSIKTMLGTKNKFIVPTTHNKDNKTNFNRQVLSNNFLKNSEKIILVYFAEMIQLSANIHKLKYCYPSLNTIAEGTGQTLRTIKTSIKSLEEKGFIEVIRYGKQKNKNFKSNNYYILSKNFIGGKNYPDEKQISEKDRVKITPQDTQKPQNFTGEGGKNYPKGRVKITPKIIDNKNNIYIREEENNTNTDFLNSFSSFNGDNQVKDFITNTISDNKVKDEVNENISILRKPEQSKKQDIKEANNNDVFGFSEVDVEYQPYTPPKNYGRWSYKALYERYHNDALYCTNNSVIMPLIKEKRHDVIHYWLNWLMWRKTFDFRPMGNSTKVKDIGILYSAYMRNSDVKEMFESIISENIRDDQETIQYIKDFYKAYGYKESNFVWALDYIRYTQKNIYSEDRNL